MNTLTASRGVRRLIATAICGALASSVGTASAADRSEPASKIVKFAELNISKPAGAAVLYDRIRAAAQGVCSYYLFKSDAAEKGCMDDTIANAVVKVNQPALFAIYNAKHKTPLPTALVSQSR
jgi:UrcA family protein